MEYAGSIPARASNHTTQLSDLYSPLFETVYTDQAPVERVSYGAKMLPEPFHGLSLRDSDAQPQIRSVEGFITPTIRVTSIERAENAVLELAGTPSFVFDPLEHTADTFPQLPAIITGAANRIAACSRIGAGNKVLMHPDNLHHLHAFLASDTTTQTVGRWNHAGRLQNSMDVYVSDEAPKDILYVILCDGTRTPAQLIRNSSGVYVGFIENDAQFMGNAADYIRTIEIKR